MNPHDDSFVSIGGHTVMKIFDLNSDQQTPKAEMDVSEEGCQLIASFDTEGVALAAAIYKEEEKNNYQRIDLYDIQKYEKGRFSSFRLDNVSRIMHMEFSSDGEYIAVTTITDEVVLIHSFKGNILARYSGFTHDKEVSYESSFSPDSKFLVTGSSDGNLFIFDTIKNRGNPTSLAELEGHVKPVCFVKFNPHFVMMASACQNVILWIPKFMA